MNAIDDNIDADVLATLETHSTPALSFFFWVRLAGMCTPCISDGVENANRHARLSPFLMHHARALKTGPCLESSQVRCTARSSRRLKVSFFCAPLDNAIPDLWRMYSEEKM